MSPPLTKHDRMGQSSLSGSSSSMALDSTLHADSTLSFMALHEGRDSLLDG